MIIEIPKIPPDGMHIQGEESARLLELDRDPLIKCESPVFCDFFAQLVSHELVVSGTLKADVTARCSKCAEFFSTTVVVSSFLRAYAIPEGLTVVDMNADIREDILLNLPAFPVCSAECRGLCPQCGKNLNEGKCDCNPPEGGTGNWSVLDKLKWT